MTEKELNDAISVHRQLLEMNLGEYRRSRGDEAKARYLADAAKHASVFTALVQIADGK